MTEPTPRVCPACKRPSQTAGEQFCPHDGAILIEASDLRNADLAHDGRVVQRFHQEARATARLSHRNLATVYTSGSTSDGIYYIAMEHLNGPSLEQLIASAWHSVAIHPTYNLERLRVMRLWCQIVAALAHAHRLGIVHRAHKRKRSATIRYDS